MTGGSVGDGARLQRVIGVGGVFLRARDPEHLLEWYRTHLGLDIRPGETWAVLEWGAAGNGSTTWAVFGPDSDYFGPKEARSMVNYRVEDLDRMLEQLRAAGAEVDERVEETEYGRFGWAVDGEGNRFELWQPPPGR